MRSNFDRNVELELELYQNNTPPMADVSGRVKAIASIDRYPVPQFPLYPRIFPLNVRFNIHLLSSVYVDSF